MTLSEDQRHHEKSVTQIYAIIAMSRNAHQLLTPSKKLDNLIRAALNSDAEKIPPVQNRCLLVVRPEVKARRGWE